MQSSSYNTPSCNCPYCNSVCKADWVDVGVGMEQCGPYYCTNCRASEIGRFDDIGFDIQVFYDWMDENYKLVKIDEKYEQIFIGIGDRDFKIPETATISQKEWDKGWYKPNSPMGSSVNTCNGEYIDHKTAKKLYDAGLLDLK